MAFQNTKLIDVTLLEHFEKKLAEKYATKESLGTTEKQTTTTNEMSGLVGSLEQGDIVKNTDNGHYYQYVGEGEPGADENGFVDIGDSMSFSNFASNEALKKEIEKAGQEVDTKLGEYTKTEDLGNATQLTEKFATKDMVNNLGTILGELETESELQNHTVPEVSVGDCYVTKDTKHIHYFNGSSWVDLGGDIDMTTVLEPYAQTATVNGQLEQKVDKVEGSSLVETAKITQIETNKASIESLTSSLENYVKSVDVQVAEQADIDALFSPAPVI